MLGKLIGGLAPLVIAIAILPSITKTINSATNSTMNSTSMNATNVIGTATSALSPAISIVPIIFAFAIFILGLIVVYNGLREGGIIGSKDIRKELDKSNKIIKEAMTNNKYKGVKLTKEEYERIKNENK